MKVFSIYNIKGGVGKTTSTVNLAFISALEGVKTLVWDLDPQGGASYYLCHKARIPGGAKALVKGKRSFDELIRSSGYPNLDLLPADASYRNLEQYLNKDEKSGDALKKLIKPLRSRYERLFLDCPPGLTLLSENILHATDVLLVPLIPTPLSLRSYNTLVSHLVKNNYKKINVIPFFNMVNTNNSIHSVVTKNVREKHPIFLKHGVPHSNIIEAMGVKRAPVCVYARESREGVVLQSIWDEIKSRQNPASK